MPLTSAYWPVPFAGAVQSPVMVILPAELEVGSGNGDSPSARNSSVLGQERQALARHPLRGAFCGSSLQELALANVLCQRCGTFELGARLPRTAELPQEVAADGRQQVVRRERGLVDERVHKVEAGSGTERHPHGDRPVQLDDERSEERRVGKECRSRWSPDHS